MPSNKPQPIILVDFDGVLHSYKSGWQGPEVIPDPPVPGALSWLAGLLASEKFQVAIYSSRSKQDGGRNAMLLWLARWFLHEKLDGPGFDLLKRLQFPTQKPAAFLTIDDRCIQFQGPGTFPTIPEIENFKPWNKRGI